MNHLPGFELVLAGLADLKRRVLSPNAYLVAVGAPRLRRLGIDVPVDVPEQPELALYRELRDLEGDAAHGSYLALVRRLESFERALERELRGQTGPVRPRLGDGTPADR